MNPTDPAAAPPTAKERLLGAALTLIRSHGFAATSLNAVCDAAGVTKGAFFHHFASKEALGVAAAEHWSQTTGKLFAGAPYHALAHPLARVFGYIDFRARLLQGPVEDFTCLAGTLLQETFLSSPAIRAACDTSIGDHATKVEADIALALAARPIPGIDARDLALHIQAVLQGAFILAKAKGSADIARASVTHLKRYFELLFNRA